MRMAPSRNSHSAFQSCTDSMSSKVSTHFTTTENAEKSLKVIVRVLDSCTSAAPIFHHCLVQEKLAGALTLGSAPRCIASFNRSNRACFCAWLLVTKSMRMLSSSAESESESESPFLQSFPNKMAINGVP